MKCFILLATFGFATAACGDSSAFKAEEQDWLLSAAIVAGQATTPTTQTDASGGCDGIREGAWGFHTGRQKNPWWHVDLGATESLSRIVIWNRCDGGGGRAARLLLKLSDDGRTWRTVYTHNGTAFGGASDHKPLHIAIPNQSARFVRVQLPDSDFLHLDEIEVFGPTDSSKNLALHRNADQSSISQWSVSHVQKHEPDWDVLTRRALTQASAIRTQHSLTQPSSSPLPSMGRGARGEGWSFPSASDVNHVFTRSDYLAARAHLRELLFSEPLLDFSDLLFVKRSPGSFSHMSDQYYGWWSRPGGGIFILKNWKSPSPGLVELTPRFAPGTFLKPELSFDAKRVLFSYCQFHPGVRGEKDKTHKQNVPEDAFYHVFEMSIDGSNVRQLTHGRYDDFNARYLPDGTIAFLSTRRGTFLQTGQCAAETLASDALPDSYVRCGGDNWRPVAVYTLHVMDGQGKNLRAISPFENFEWDPVLANDGRIVYARWDYVDRDNMPYMSLWSTNPDGTNPQLVYGNHTRSPYGVFESRPIPNSRKFVFTASAHHSISGGSLCLLDPDYGNEGSAPLTRLTPEVVFPEIEGWSQTWYATPFPLSEQLFLTAWSARPLFREGQSANETNALGLYVYHSGGTRELIYRDRLISSSDPIPVRPRAVPQVVSTTLAKAAPQDGQFLLLDVYQGLEGVRRGSIKSLRVIGVPAKVQPHMNTPSLGLTADDPGKFILGTVPVEVDGSARFRAPSGVNIFFQALDARGFAIQTMRTVTYVQAGETLSCVGCHEHRATAPFNHNAMAVRRAPSNLAPGPDGTWPFRFDHLVGSVLQAKCVRCHEAGAPDKRAARFNLTPSHAYESLVSYGSPSLREQVRKGYYEGRSVAQQGGAQTSSLLSYLQQDPVHVPLLDDADVNRIATWLDVYGQRLGSFSDEQEQQLLALRVTLGHLLDQPGKKAP